MLTELQKSTLKSKGLTDGEIQGVKDFDIMEGKITFDNGDEKTITEIYSRCMGYFRPREDYNIGKRQEHLDRKMFTESKAFEAIDKMASNDKL